MPGDDSGKPRMTAAEVFKALAEMFKAMPSGKLDGIKDVEDLWSTVPSHSNEHSLPGRDETGPFGPAERMSGGGAPKMVREYSEFAPQSTMVQMYDQMGKYMAPIGKAINVLASNQADMGKAHKAMAELIEGFLKAEETKAAEEAAKKAVEPQFGEDSYTGNALRRFQKAKTAFRKSDFADEGERELRRGLLDEAMTSLKAARSLLVKAEEAGEDLRGDTTEKALADIKELSARVAKAQEDIAKADKDDEDKKEKEAEDAKKAEEAAAVAAAVPEAAKSGDNCGTDATTEDEKDNTATKATELPPELQAQLEKLTKAVEGQDVLQTTLKDFMDTFMKASRFAPPPSFVSKAAPLPDIEQRIETAKDSGVLSTVHECTLADSLLTRHRMADAGSYPKEKLHEDMARAPETVRNLFIVREAA